MSDGCDGLKIEHEGMKAWLPSEDHGCSCDNCDPVQSDGFGHWHCKSCEDDMSPVRIPCREYFGLDRDQPVHRFSDDYITPMPSWRTRIYRAWRALLGDFG